MPNRKKIIVALAFIVLAFTFAAPAANAKPGEYELIVKHLKTKYRAKKVKIPFMWLARAAVSVVRPAGIKSFSITLFEDLKFSRATLDEEMQDAMKNSLSEEWGPILRVRSRQGQQVYMYMREAGKNVKVMLVAIDEKESAIIRATFSPDRLADFINDPKVFGISLNDNDQKSQSPDGAPNGPTEKSMESLKDLEKIAPAGKEEKPKEEPKKDN